MRKAKSLLLLAATMMCLSVPLAAADVVIKGMVTDSAGKPVRGATVKAVEGFKSVSRFTQKDGRYDITVAPGTYGVTVEAYGFAIKKESVDTTKGEETNFRLVSAPLSLDRLSGAELENLLPDSPDAKLLAVRCNECHSYPTILRRRGLSAQEWKSFLPNMVGGSTDEPYAKATPEALTVISTALGKYFGPDSPYFGPDAEPVTLDKIKHVDLSDEALRATVVEYAFPTANAKPHSIEIDLKTNIAWFAEESYFGNSLVKFDINAEKFHEYPLLTKKARPHTGAVGPDGTYWCALAHSNDPAKLASVDPETGVVKQYNWPEQAATPAHTLTLDRKGNIWFSGSPSGELWTFDVSKKEFKTVKYPIPATFAKGTQQDWEQIPGEPVQAPRAETYDVAVDNEGMVWFSQITIGMLVRLNPATGETKEVRPEGVVSIRGITVDDNDNLWFGDYHGHRLGKLNVKTLDIKFYKAPTANFAVYGVTMNKADGNLWFADLNGNNITRFNPKTEQFTEFRVPSRPERTYPRFIGADAKGRVWFTEYFGDKIGYVDPSGGKTAGQMSSAR